MGGNEVVTKLPNLYLGDFFSLVELELFLPANPPIVVLIVPLTSSVFC